jgi:hypothetical protein
VLKEDDYNAGSSLFNLCFAISLFARRCLVLNSTVALNPNLFLQRFHALFKGDIRITSNKDDFVLSDPDNFMVP